MTYTISYQKNGVYQAIGVNAQTAEQAAAYFAQYKPAAEFIGIREGMENKPGFPVVTVPDDFQESKDEAPEVKAESKTEKTMQTVSKISISPGNQKKGYIPSVSLPPVVTCANNCTCAKKCYAAKLCRIRKSVREAYDRNLQILTTDPAAYWLQVKAAAMVTKYFRFHVSGDIPDMDYLRSMARIARELPGTRFLCFTKKYDLVNDFLFCEDRPENLQLIFSAWPGMPMENPHNLPIANVIFKGQEPAENWKICGGNCAECACRGVGCWELRPGEQIAFYEH